jgi:hypothetical protein
LSLIEALEDVLLGLGESSVGEKLGDLGVELLEKLRLLAKPVEDDKAVGEDGSVAARRMDVTKVEEEGIEEEKVWKEGRDRRRERIKEKTHPSALSSLPMM